MLRCGARFDRVSRSHSKIYVKQLFFTCLVILCCNARLHVIIYRRDGCNIKPFVKIIMIILVDLENIFLFCRITLTGAMKSTKIIWCKELKLYIILTSPTSFAFPSNLCVKKFYTCDSVVTSSINKTILLLIQYVWRFARDCPFLIINEIKRNGIL